MKTTRFASAAALLALLSTPASAAKQLQPTGKWNVDFGDAHCVAMRSYGPASRPITLALKPAPIGDVVQLSLVRDSWSRQVAQYDGSITIDQAAPVKVSMLGFAGGDSKQRITSVNLPAAQFQPVKSASQLRLRAEGEIEHSLALSNMATVTNALDRCIAGLRAAWHVGPAAASIRQEAVPHKPIRDYFDSKDYPMVALRNRAAGVTELMMLIDETGKIAGCMVTASSGFASLDAQSCGVLTERARFTPAIGVDGKPAKSGLLRRIRWITG